MATDVVTIIENALKGIIQPELAKFLELFLRNKNENFWEEWVRKSFCDRYWNNGWTELKDMDIIALVKVCGYCNTNLKLFDNNNDADFGNLQSLLGRIYQIKDLRNRLAHNGITNVNGINRREICELISFLNVIKASEESIESMEKIIQKIYTPAPITKSESILRNKRNEEMGTLTSIYNTENIWRNKRKEVINFCNNKCGGIISKIKEPYTIAAENYTVQGVFWANPRLEVLRDDWYIILNDWQQKYFHIFFIPANTFKVDDFKIKTNRLGKKLQLEINKDFIETNRNINLKRFLKVTIEYKP